jgi:hypothetical protein
MQFKHRLLLAALGATLMAPADDSGGGGGNAPAPAPEPTPAPTPAPSAEKTVQARVLTDCAHGKANDLVTLPKSVAKEVEALGLVDTDKGAVAYAAALAQNQPKPAADKA